MDKNKIIEIHVNTVLRNLSDLLEDVKNNDLSPLPGTSKEETVNIILDAMGSIGSGEDAKGTKLEKILNDMFPELSLM